MFAIRSKGLSLTAELGTATPRRIQIEKGDGWKSLIAWALEVFTDECLPKLEELDRAAREKERERLNKATAAFENSDAMRKVRRLEEVIREAEQAQRVSADRLASLDAAWEKALGEPEDRSGEIEGNREIEREELRRLEARITALKESVIQAKRQAEDALGVWLNAEREKMIATARQDLDKRRKAIEEALGDNLVQVYFAMNTIARLSVQQGRGTGAERSYAAAGVNPGAREFAIGGPSTPFFPGVSL
jgi:HPt (histidine-containing phosphotransfer) domain-containing protein